MRGLIVPWLFCLQTQIQGPFFNPSNCLTHYPLTGTYPPIEKPRISSSVPPLDALRLRFAELAPSHAHLGAGPAGLGGERVEDFRFCGELAMG